MNPKDKPTDELIENDYELDRWFDGYIKDLQRRAGGRPNQRPVDESVFERTAYKPGD